MASDNNFLNIRENISDFIVEHGVDAILTINNRGTILTANPATTTLFGYSQDEMIGQNVKMLMPEPFHGEHDQYVGRYVDTRQAKIIGIGREVVGRRKDGSTFPIDLAVSEINVNGQQLFAGILRDVTAKKELAVELQRSEARLRAAIETAVDAILTIDARGIIQTMNPATTALFGYSEGELIGQNIKMLMPEPFHDEHDQYIGRYVDTRQAKIIGIGREVIGRRKDGSTFPMDLAVSEMILDGQQMFTGIVRDVSAKHQLTQEIKSSESRLRAVIDTAVDGIVTIDTRGTILTVNPATTTLFGYQRSEMIGQNVKMLMPEPFHGEHDQYVGHYVETREAKIIGIGREVVGRRKDGTTFPMDLAVSEMVIDGQQMFTGIVRDATERKNAEDAREELLKTLQASKSREQLLRDLEASNRDLEDFAYVVSHDLKAPLRAIGSIAGWISQDYAEQLDEDGQELISILVSRANRMEALITGILKYSRLGKETSKFERLDLEKTVANVIDLLAPPAHIEVIVKRPLAHVVGDATQLEQLFQNLVTNAIKFIDKPQGKIEIAMTTLTKTDVTISVSDNGPGIAPEYFGKIFQIFQTLQARDDFESTGIGLSIVKKIIDLHHGEVWVESEVGTGTTFYLKLPRDQKSISNT